MKWWWDQHSRRPTRYYSETTLRIDMSPHSDTLSWFRANQSLLFLLNVACLAEKQQIPILQSLVWPYWGLNTRSTALEASTLTITPPMWLFIERNWEHPTIRHWISYTCIQNLLHCTSFNPIYHQTLPFLMLTDLFLLVVWLLVLYFAVLCRLQNLFLTCGISFLLHWAAKQ